MDTGTTLTRASRQWAFRPDDERFLSLEDLLQMVSTRYMQSWTTVAQLKDLRVYPEGDNDLRLTVADRARGEVSLDMTHWGFGQLASAAGVPPSYLRKLPADFAAMNIQYCMENLAVRPDGLLLAQSNGAHVMRGITTPRFGRIWDKQVVEACIQANRDGNWVIPAASYAASNPKRATTLYGSDRDVFVFLCDPTHPVEVGGDTLFRGFMVWNSEVGNAVFGLTTFLYRRICDNRIVWGASQVRELRIRHTSGAPERFASEGERYLQQYANESALPIMQTINAAQAFEIPIAEKFVKEQKRDEGIANWLQERGFTAGVAKKAVEAAKVEEGQARSLWDIVNGITAHARSIPHTNERVTLETQAGKLLDRVKVG